MAGVDIGTTAVKAVTVDDNGKIFGRARVASRLAIGRGGTFEHEAAASWWEAPRSALRQVLGAGRPRAVAVSAMMPSVTAVDGTGRPLGPGLLYGDGRIEASPAGVSGDPTASDEMTRLCRWVAARHPAAAGYWPAQAVANASLGGEGVTDLASAFAAGPLFGGSGWDDANCEAAGFPASRLPRVAVFGEAIGRLAPGVLGEGDAGGGDAVLGAGSVDGMCEQLVAGTVEEGDVLVALGSTLVVWLTVAGWPDEVPGLWRAPHVAAGMAMLGGASNAGGMWADWVDRVLRPGPEDAAARPGRCAHLVAVGQGGEGPLARPGPARRFGRGRHLSWPASLAARCVRGYGFRRPAHSGAGVGARHAAGPFRGQRWGHGQPGLVAGPGGGPGPARPSYGRA